MPNEPQDNLKTLHRNLLREGYQIPADYSKFQMDMRDDNKIQKLWGNLKSEYDLPEFDKFKSDMGMTGPKAPLIKGNIEEAMLGDTFKKSKDDSKEAIDRSIDLYNRAYNLNPNSPESKSKRKQYEDGLASGDFSVITGPSGRLKLARKATAGEALTNSLKSSKKSYDESKNLKDMSNYDAVRYMEDKFGKEEVMPSITEGILPKITETLGGFGRLAAKQGAGAMAVESAALLLAPETGGLSLAALAAIGGIAGAGDELSTQEYGGNLMKYYMQGKAEGLAPKDAIERARTQAERASKVGYAEAVGYEFAGKAAGGLFPKNVTGEGIKAAVGKFLLHAAPEIAGAATIAGGSSLAKDISAKELGYKVSNKEMFDNAWNEASDIGKFMLATTALHGVANGVTKMPNYVKSQLKNFVTSVQEGVPEKVLNNLKNAGVLKAADVEKTLGSLKDFKKAKKDIEPLNVEDETIQGSLAGKQEKKNKLKTEIEELNKNGVKVGVKKKQAEIDKLDKEMEAIHETGDVDKHEHDQDFGINARVEETKGGKKLFIDDLEVTPEEFEYVTGKKPEEYPTETIQPTEEVKPTKKVTPENIESIYKDKKIKIKIQDAKTYEGGYEQKEEYKTYDANTLKKTGDNEYTIGEEKTGRLNVKINENGELETLPTFGVEGNRPIEVIEEKPTTKTNIKKRKKIVKDISVKLKSIDESKIQPIPKGYFDTPEKQDLLNKFKNETITDAEIDNAMELFTDDEFIYIDKNFMQYPPEIEEALAQIVPEMMAKKYKDIPRGADEIKSTIENGVKKGKINEDSAKIASVLLDKRPDLFNELGLLLSPDEESFGSLGSYDPINKTIEIFKTNEDATTIGHELLHHTEKFLPKDIKIAIREEWLSAINKEVNSLNNNIKKENLNETDLKRAKKALEYLKEVKENDEMYQNIDTLDVNKYLNQRDGLYHYFRGEDGLTRKYYNMFDASEWWANHGAEMLKDYALVKDKKAFIEKIKDFYKELIQAIKEFVSPTKAREVENALNNLFKGAYEKFEGSNIASSRFETIKKSVEEPKYSQTEEGKKVDEDAKKMGFDNVTHAINSVNEALGTDYKTFQEIKPKELQEAIDIRDHNKAFEEIIKGTEYEKQAGDIKSSGEATTGTTGEVSGKPEAKEQYTHTDAGFRYESDARAAYEQRGDKDVNQTYEEFLFSKACGDF